MGQNEGEITPKHPGGRPKQVTGEQVEEAARLRDSGLPWKQIGLRLALNPETCRRARWVVKRSRLAVGNSPVAVKNSALEV
jgi:hypothetical protein